MRLPNISTFFRLDYSDLKTKQKMTYLVTSDDGPAIKLVPVSEIAWHPPLQNIVDPILTPSILNCQYPFLVTGTKIYVLKKLLDF